MNSRTTLEIYRLGKLQIRQEKHYDNSFESCLLFRARSNSLQLGWRKRFNGEDTSCPVCNIGIEETLQHFVTGCAALEDLRIVYGVNMCSIQQILLLETGCEAENVKKYLGDIWKRRSFRLSG